MLQGHSVPPQIEILWHERVYGRYTSSFGVPQGDISVVLSRQQSPSSFPQSPSSFFNPNPFHQHRELHRRIPVDGLGEATVD